MQRLPDFIGVGAQKSGTTTLHQILRSHEDIYMPKEKELQYFTFKYKKGIDYYSRKFDGAKVHQKVGEITPYYLFHEKTAERIHKLCNNAYIIILLRDPTTRAISQYFHSRKLGFESEDMETAFNLEEKRLRSGSKYSHQKHSYLARSKYMDQINRFEMYFPKEQLIIEKSEEMFERPGTVINRVLSRLGIKEMSIARSIGKANRGSYISEVDSRTVNYLNNELKKTKEEIKKKYNISWDKL